MAVQSSNRKWMFIGVGVVAAGAVVVFINNYPPRSGDSAGTIGGAQRYHSTQITGADVKVTETEVSKWMQSDTFDRIVKDPEARKLFADAAVQRLFTQDALTRGSAAASTDQLSAATKDKMASIMANDQLSAATKDKMASIMANDQLSASIKDKMAGMMVNDKMVGMLNIDNMAVQKALQNAAILDALHNQDFCRALANQSLLNALAEKAQNGDSLAKQY